VDQLVIRSKGGSFDFTVRCGDIRIEQVNGCGWIGPTYTDREKAIEAWNKRWESGELDQEERDLLTSYRNRGPAAGGPGPRV